MTFRLAHLSDCHLGPLPPVRWPELMSKRVLGYINWQRNRGKAMVSGTIEHLVDDLKAQAPDHIAVTGDLVNLGLEAEFERAGTFLKTLGNPDTVTAIPGNHDAYVPGALARFNVHCAPYLTSDEDAGAASPYPVVRQRGPVAVIGLSSACATGPFMATGKVSADQKAKLSQTLTDRLGTFRIVLIHHPPQPKAGPRHKRLVGAQSVRALLAAAGAELVLHGHTHLPTRTEIPGPGGPIAVYGVASAAQSPGGHKPPANYTLFDIEEAGDSWQVTATRRGYPAAGGAIADLSVDRFAVPKP